jgi:hypothetical protein
MFARSVRNEGRIVPGLSSGGVEPARAVKSVETGGESGSAEESAGAKAAL